MHKDLPRSRKMACKAAHKNGHNALSSGSGFFDNKSMLLLIVAFSLGYIVNNVAEDWSFGLIADAEAEVAGMDRYDLKYDYDFKKAVEDIIESCAVDGDELDC